MCPGLKPFPLWHVNTSAKHSPRAVLVSYLKLLTFKIYVVLRYVLFVCLFVFSRRQPENLPAHKVAFALKLIGGLRSLQTHFWSHFSAELGFV